MEQTTITIAIALLSLAMGCLIGIEIVWRRISHIKEQILEEMCQKLKSEKETKNS
jgi:hypothetical protein